MFVCTYMFLLCPRRIPRSSDITEAINTPSTYILVSNYIFQHKESEFFGEVSDSKTGLGNT